VQLSLSQSTAFHRWWSSFTTFAPTDREEVRPELISLLQSHYEPPPLPPGLALPGDDLLLVCGSPEAQTVWRYNLGGESWTEELALDVNSFSAVVTDEERYFIAALQFDELDDDSSTRGLSVWLVEPGEQPALMAGAPGVSWLPLAKHGPVVPAAFFADTESGEPSFGTVDLSSCGDAGCAHEVAPGYVLPSPDGENELASMALFDAPDLFLRPRGGEWQQLPEQGYAPFWLDVETFAYLENAETGTMRLIVQTLSGEAAVLVEDSNLPPTAEAGLDLIPAGGFYHRASGRIILAGQNSDGSVVLLGVPRPAGGSWLAAEPVTPVVMASADGSVIFSFVPLTSHERWLVLMVNEPGAQSPLLWLLDLTGEQPQWTSGAAPDVWLLPGYDWSPDGLWLAWLSDSSIRLAAPAYRDAYGEPYQLLIPHTQPSCSFLAWLER
jgi:hypothetical protein